MNIQVLKWRVWSMKSNFYFARNSIHSSIRMGIGMHAHFSSCFAILIRILFGHFIWIMHLHRSKKKFRREKFRERARNFMKPKSIVRFGRFSRGVGDHVYLDIFLLIRDLHISSSFELYDAIQSIEQNTQPPWFRLVLRESTFFVVYVFWFFRNSHFTPDWALFSSELSRALHFSS